MIITAKKKSYRSGTPRVVLVLEGLSNESSLDLTFMIFPPPFSLPPEGFKMGVFGIK